jgi:hypothetical protein
MPYLSEDEIEQAVLAQLEGMGYAVAADADTLMETGK